MTEPNQMIEPDQPLPYLEVTDEAYATAAAQTFSVVEVEPGTLALRGPCPRCNAVIEIPHVDNVVRSALPSGGAPEGGEPMICTCDGLHPNRPDGLYGCGAYWTLIISEQRP